eukprot:TRINITY_DN1202_c0_g1_i2.p1 TRINITY_DN1202_c0_g1~~TRINITY_DN1202_c0_g1_i2.p1  ORF type:complete len:240 (+),score=48.65 TRINITY_DN1202_c0_g1_i2:111-722(+)
MAELQSLHEDPSDAQSINSIRGLEAELRSMCLIKSTQAKDIIKAFTERVETLERTSAPPDTEGHARTMADLATAKSESQSEITRLHSKLAETEAEVSETTESLGKVKKLAATSASDYWAELPQLKYANTLYANITRVKWDFTAPDGQLVGFVTQPHTETVTSFSIDTAKGDRFAIANQLWDIIDGTHAEDPTSMSRSAALPAL